MIIFWLFKIFLILIIINEIYCKNSYGQLGQGNTNNIGDGPNEMGNNLAFIDLGLGRTAKAVATGHYHTCVILDNDSVKCFGYNE